MLRNHFGYKYHLYSHLLFWKMTCKIIFHFQAMRVLLFLNHVQRYKIACRWLRTSLLPKNKSFCSVRNPFGKWKLWQLYNEREIMQTYLFTDLISQPNQIWSIWNNLPCKWTHAKVSLIFCTICHSLKRCQQIILN